MCEHTPGCTRADDPEAIALWKRRRDASWLVTCPVKDCHCPIAAVFDLPTRGEVLVTPGYTALRRSLLVDTREGPQLVNPDAKIRMHAGVTPLNEYAAEERIAGRCGHGTWSFAPSQITSRLFGTNDRGQRLTFGGYVMMADSPDKPVRD